MHWGLLKLTDFTNKYTNLCEKIKQNYDAAIFLKLLTSPVIWLQISNCHFDLLQNSGLFRIYSFMAFNILDFITIYVRLQ